MCPDIIVLALHIFIRTYDGPCEWSCIFVAPPAWQWVPDREGIFTQPTCLAIQNLDAAHVWLTSLQKG